MKILETLAMLKIYAWCSSQLPCLHMNKDTTRVMYDNFAQVSYFIIHSFCSSSIKSFWKLWYLAPVIFEHFASLIVEQSVTIRIRNSKILIRALSWYSKTYHQSHLYDSELTFVIVLSKSAWVPTRYRLSILSLLIILRLKTNLKDFHSTKRESFKLNMTEIVTNVLCMSSGDLLTRQNFELRFLFLFWLRK